MSYTQYHPDTDSMAARMDSPERETEVDGENVSVGRLAGRAPPDDNPHNPEGHPAFLHTIVESIAGGISPLQFMDSIDTGNRELGNRALLRWVGQQYAAGEYAPQQNGGRFSAHPQAGMTPVAGPAPVQMLDRKDKRDKKPQGTGATPDSEAIETPEDISDTESDSDIEDADAEFMAAYFPAMFAFYNLLLNRAEHIETAGHGAMSLAGAANMLASVLSGMAMILVGLPMDILVNLLGALARVIMLICDIFPGVPSTLLLNAYFRRHPPSAADRARAGSETIPRGPPRGIDWNVSLPEILFIFGFSGYWTAASVQGSLAPSLWIHPWNAARVCSIIAKVVTDIIVYMLQFTVFPQLSRHVFQNRLGWNPTRAGLFLAELNVLFSAVVTYILSFLTNAEGAIYLIRQNFIEDDGASPEAATAALIGFAALGIVVQMITSPLFLLFVFNRVNEQRLIPWLRQFRAIPNRLVRTIAVALAAFRNIFVNLMSISLTLGQLAANMIGPLAPRFGEGGVCFWPLAVADVCGGPPAGFNITEVQERIAAGEQSLTFRQLFAIQIFPWLVGLLGIGMPVLYVMHKYRRATRAGRARSVLPEMELSEILLPGDAGPAEDNAVAETAFTEPGESQASGPAGVIGPQPGVELHSGATPAATSMTAQMLFEFLLKLDRLTPAELREILEQHVATGDITDEEAGLIEQMVREEVVLSKEPRLP